MAFLCLGCKGVCLMDVLDELRGLGVDVDGGLKRVMGNEKLYRRLLGTFVKTAKNNEVQPDFDATDCTEIIEKAHAIKGTAGNMSITPLFEAYSEILNLLRSGKPEEARTALQKILPVQKEILDCIERHME